MEIGKVVILVVNYCIEECMVVFLLDMFECYVWCGFFVMCFNLMMVCIEIVNYLWMVLEIVSCVFCCLSDDGIIVVK